MVQASYFWYATEKHTWGKCTGHLPNLRKHHANRTAAAAPNTHVVVVVEVVVEVAVVVVVVVLQHATHAECALE